MTVNGDSGRHGEWDDEVARRLASGESYRQIAGEIGMSLYHSENQKTLTKDDWHNGLKVDLGPGDGPQKF